MKCDKLDKSSFLYFFFLKSNFLEKKKKNNKMFSLQKHEMNGIASDRKATQNSETTVLSRKQSYYDWMNIANLPQKDTSQNPKSFSTET